MSSIMFRKPTFVIWLLLMSCLLTSTACAKHRHGSASSADNTPGSFDYYLLTLSWAPEFCATHAGNTSSSECDPHRHFGFVVHGLWPENDNGSYPQNCAPAQPVAQQTVQHMLAIMPARGLIQHEWATHGTCSGLSTQDYFADIEKAFRAGTNPAGVSRAGAAHPGQPGRDRAEVCRRQPRARWRLSGVVQWHGIRRH